MSRGLRWGRYGLRRDAACSRPWARTSVFHNLQWYHRNRTLLTVLVGAAGIAAFVLLWPLWPLAWTSLLAIVLERSPMSAVHHGGRPVSIGLRSIPFVKAFLIAVLWAVVTVAVPLHLDPAGLSTFTIAATASNACSADPRAGHHVRHPWPEANDDAGLCTVPLVFGTRVRKR